MGSSTSTQSPVVLRRQLFAENIAALRTRQGSAVVNRISVKCHTTAGDGGHGDFRWVSGAAVSTYSDNNGTIIVPTGGDGSAAWLRDFADEINVHWFGAKGDGATDDTTAIQNALSAASSVGGARCVLIPVGNFIVTAPLLLSGVGTEIVGKSRRYSAILAGGGFSGVAVIHVFDNVFGAIRNLYVDGGALADCVRNTNSANLALRDLWLKNGIACLRLLTGNIQDYRNIYCDKGTDGFVVDPANDTNGSVFSNIRAHMCSNWGIDIKQGTVDGALFNQWHLTAEANGVGGIRIRGGRYNQFYLYSEGNGAGGTNNFDISGTGNDYFIVNADNQTLPITTAYAYSVKEGRGSLMYQNQPIQKDQGTWTPTVRGGATAGTYTLANLTSDYVREGNWVTVTATFGFSVATGGSSSIVIEGFPFTKAAGNAPLGTVNVSNLNIGTDGTGLTLVSGAATVDRTDWYIIQAVNNAENIAVPVSSISTSSIITINVRYKMVP